ncbi:hypothetical protein AYI68_g7937 [Smittium mucronatum]|uniref:Uncharacterized protein n=1 Tax=Smittium mucronatum TaxID=133383 RepID=A0A1R0GM95_9FUNG|nr:hypothetical protein AYI68_g7937 [Smittium mucronatum]
MNTSSVQIYWPDNIDNREDGGFLIGWLVSPLEIVVSTIVKFQDAVLLKKLDWKWNHGPILRPRVIGIVCGSKYSSPDHWLNSSKPLNAPVWRIQFQDQTLVKSVTLISFEQFEPKTRCYYISNNSTTNNKIRDSESTNRSKIKLSQALRYINVSSIAAYSLKSNLGGDENALEIVDTNNNKNNKNTIITNCVREIKGLLHKTIVGYPLTEILGFAQLIDHRIDQFWDIICNLFFDVFLGCVTGYLLIFYSENMVNLSNEFIGGYTITALENYLLWLRSWPAGLKLNNGLGEFLGELFLWLIHFWKGGVYLEIKPTSYLETNINKTDPEVIFKRTEYSNSYIPVPNQYFDGEKSFPNISSFPNNNQIAFTSSYESRSGNSISSFSNQKLEESSSNPRNRFFESNFPDLQYNKANDLSNSDLGTNHPKEPEASPSSFLRLSESKSRKNVASVKSREVNILKRHKSHESGTTYDFLPTTTFLVLKVC